MPKSKRMLTIDGEAVIDLSAVPKLYQRNFWESGSIGDSYLAALKRNEEKIAELGVNSSLCCAHFIAQALLETGGFRLVEENLHYSSAGRLRKVFPKKYPAPSDAASHVGEPELVANHVYAQKNGNIEPDDGWKYRGRGFFQLTGRANYKVYGDDIGVDLVADPDLVSQDFDISLRVALAYWRKVGLTPYAEQNDARAVSRGINLGDPKKTGKPNHLPERIWLTHRVIRLLQEPARSGILEQLSSDEVLDIGDSGDEVRKLQQDLSRLRSDAIKADGVFGKATYEAVTKFQVGAGLAPADGRVTKDVRGAIDEALESNRDSLASNESRRTKRIKRLKR